MSKAQRPVLLVGGIPGETAEEVFRTCAPELGNLAIGLPDGEIGPRRLWALYVWHWVFENHPQLEIIRQPKGVEGLPDWIPDGYGDLMKFKVKDGLDEIQINELGYAGFAKESYTTFCKLRDEGVIPQGVRFQVCIPFPEDIARLCTSFERDFHIISAAYQNVVKREVADIVAAIPAQDLMFQWDINWEVIAVETDDGGKDEPLAFPLDGKPYDRYAGYLKNLSAVIPDEVPLGLHLCYGDYQHQHYLQPKDLGICVKMANLGVEATGRPVSFVHMPVPRDRNDDAYFAPLKDLTIGDATLYIGLVHYTDGVEGTKQRIETFRRHYTGPAGVSTECGMGRRPADHELTRLLQIHSAVVDSL